MGSGPSGVHFAQTALERGHGVTLLDVGYERPPLPAPDRTVEELKDTLDDPIGFFLGEDWSGVALPGRTASFYQFPATKRYVFRRPPGLAIHAEAIEPLLSYARGGLAETWTAGTYVWQDADLAEFPFGSDALAPHYARVAERIGIAAEPDDLDPYLSGDLPYLPPLGLDRHSADLLERYRARRGLLRDRLRFVMGRSRVATLSRAHHDRPACTELGRCLWGCPTDALYRPSVTLARCLTMGGFTYRPDRYVTRFVYQDDGRVSEVLARDPATGQETAETADIVVLAAGALNSSRIYLESLYARTGQAPRLPGLMDNRQVHLPFVSPWRLGAQPETEAYQFHHLAFGIVAPDPAGYIHGQITTLKAAAVHAIVGNLPVDYRTGLAVFHAMRAGMGIANINLRDTRRPESYVELEAVEPERPTLRLHYAPAPEEPTLRTAAVRDTRRALRRLGAWPVPGMARVLPMGASAHYAGTVPHRAAPRDHQCSPDGAVHGFRNLFMVDGAVLPALSAKNHTLTLMANACRIADRILPAP